VPVRPGRRVPALAVWPGLTLAHDAQRAAEPNRLLAVPIAPSMSRAAVASPPGILARGSRCGSHGSRRRRLGALRAALCRSNPAMRSRDKAMRRP
jgi:hypothetical protein